MNKHMFLLSILFGLILTSTVLAIEEDDFNIDVTFGWEGCYRPMEWTPISIEIQNILTEPFSGILHLSTPQDEMNELNLSHSFTLTPNVPMHIPLATKISRMADECRIYIQNANNGRIEWKNVYKLWELSMGNEINTSLIESDMLIGLIGQRKFRLFTLADHSESIMDKNRGRVYIKDKIPNKSPWDWTGYCCLDMLILYDPDWNLFNSYQLNAISDWVQNGGRLLIIIGNNPIAPDNPIIQQLPFELDTTIKTSFNNDLLSEWIPGWNTDNSSESEIICRPIKVTPGAVNISSYSNTSNVTVLATTYCGFGKVGILGFDPDNLSGVTDTEAHRFWVSICSEVLKDNSYREMEVTTRHNSYNNFQADFQDVPLRRTIVWKNTENEDDNQNIRQVYTGFAQTGANAIMEHLHNISQLRPLSIWWVILLLTLLAILLGPVDYIILKKKDKLPMTWITCSVWIVIFTAGAYYGVEYLRGGTMQLRMVSVIDNIKGSGKSWNCSYYGIFAPHSDDYIFSNNDQLHEADQWWSGITPTQEYLYAYRAQGASRRIYCRQYDGANTPQSLPINIWTMQCLLNEYSTDEFPFTAEITKIGQAYEIKINNHSDVPIESGYAVTKSDERVIFTSVPPKSTKTFNSSPSKYIWSRDIAQLASSYRNYSRTGTFSLEPALAARGVLPRTQTILSMIQDGAAAVCVQYKKNDSNLDYSKRNCNTDHTLIARQVVYPIEHEEEIK